jgi:hypothetical protein
MVVMAVVMMIWNRLVPTTAPGHAQHIEHGRHQDEAAARPP